MLQIIGSGFGRTGTSSMKAALEQLGFGPCYHMEEVFKRPRHMTLWHDVAFNRPIDWSTLFDGFESTVDFPASVVYKELMTAFPQAKVIHTVRDPERWYDSTVETIYQGGSLFPRWVQFLVPPIRHWVEMQEELIWQRLFDGEFENRGHAIQVFNQFTDEVKETVPVDRLLIFNVKEGWEP
ncbi:MAG: sulfotransferase, partial [Anaerolineae bacterium]|nr:sulfotransferase [Anaerolineae bacterium]